MPVNKKYDIMVVGELNMDLIMNQLHKPPQFGKEQKAESMTLTLGSSTAIYASNSASLGAKVAFCGKIGDDTFGGMVLESLLENGVNTDHIITDKELATGATIILQYGSERMMVTYPGAMEAMTVQEVPDELFKSSRHLHTSSIFFQPGIKNDLEILFRKAKNNGVTTSLDTQWDPNEEWDLDLKKLLPFVDFFLPNEDELLHLTKTARVNDALDMLKEFDTCTVVKMGNKGAIMQYKGERKTISAHKINDFSDAVGAGDSFNSGFLHEYLSGKDLSDCLITGNLVAAVSTTATGGTKAIKNYNQVIEYGKNSGWI